MGGLAVGWSFRLAGPVRELPMIRHHPWTAFALLLALVIAPMGQAAHAQFADIQEESAAPPPADDDAGDQQVATTLSADEIRTLVAPVALYPDELLAIVLPASTNPLQVVQASRFLEKQKADPNLKPDPTWDPAIIALLNYPQVIKQLNDDLDWTEQLGNAVMDQQKDVMDAIQAARTAAASAGYLKTNDQQVVVQDQDTNTVVIQSAQPDVIYVPTYDPTVVVNQSYVSYPPPVYSPPYPAYYAPGATFLAGAIVGASFAYAFDWGNDDIDIDCCGGGNNDIDINRGDINIGSGNNIGNGNIDSDKFNGDRRPGGDKGGMKWSPQKAREKSTAARKPSAKPTSAKIANSLGGGKSAARPTAKVQSGKNIQKQSQRGQASLATTKKPKSALTKSAGQKQQFKSNRQAQQQRPAKAVQSKQLKQNRGGAFSQMPPQQRAKAQSSRGSSSLQSRGQSRPKRR
jgi:hypothetical protein